MKIRSDFVTNSSSSSFVFKEVNEEQLEKAILKRLSEPRVRCEEEEDKECLIDWAKSIIGKRFKEHRFEDLQEVHTWYWDEILSVILGIECWNNWDEEPCWKAKVKNKFSEKKFSKETDRKLAALFVLDVYFKCFNTENPDAKEITISLEFVDAHMWKYVRIVSMFDTDWIELLLFPIDEIDKYFSIAKEFEGKLLADVMEYVFDAKYLYYDDLETHYLIAEALNEAGLCVYSCNHMG